MSLATLDEAARHIEREAGKQDAKATNDVDCDEGKSMGTVIRGIDCHDAPKQSAIEVWIGPGLRMDAARATGAHEAT